MVAIETILLLLLLLHSYISSNHDVILHTVGAWLFDLGTTGGYSLHR